MTRSGLLMPEAPTAVPSSMPSRVRRPPRAPRGTSRRVRRNRTFALFVLLGLTLAAWFSVRALDTPGAATHLPAHHLPPHHAVNPRLSTDWDGDGQAVTLAFGGDVNFPVDSTLGDRLAADPASALGSGVPQLLSGADLSMVNFESALTDGTCPDPAPKEYTFWAPPTVVTAFRGAHVTLVTEANNHGEDCGTPGLATALSVKASSGYPILGIGHNVAQAFTSYQTVLRGQHIGIIAATQVIDSDLNEAWTATPTQAGLASAYDVDALVAAVQAARRIDDTVVVFLHWGIQLDACPDPIQEPLATVLVKAGADIVVGSHAHVLLGAGYLGTALVDYGLGNFAFYNDPAPTNDSGSLIVRVTGRHIDGYTWRPAVIQDELPVPAGGAEGQAVLSRWEGARSCTDLTASPTRTIASPVSQSTPAPPGVVARLDVND